MKLDILFHYEVNDLTGEITYIGKEEIKIDTKSSKDSNLDPNPKLYLEDNKCRLNNAAINLMQVKVGDKIDVRYEGNDSLPIICIGTSINDFGGCKLTKANTFSCRGTKHDELAKRGSKFTIKNHPDKNDIFILENEDIKLQKEESKTDELDLDLESLISDEDNETEINSNFFKF